MTDRTELPASPLSANPSEVGSALPAQRAPGPRRWVRWGIVGLIFLALVAVVAIYVLRNRPAHEPPVVDLQGVEPRVAAAIEEARASVNRSPTSAETWGRLGMVLLAHQFWEEARRCFAEAERLNRDEPRWPYFQAVVLTRENLQAAILKLRRTVELCYDEPDGPRLKLADALLVEGQTADATEQFQQLLVRHPSHPAAHLGLARLAFERGNLQESRDHLEYAKGSPFTRKAALTLLATVLHRQGQQAAALQETRLIAGLPDDAAWPDPFQEAVTQLAVDRGSRIVRVVQLLNQRRVSEGIAALDELVSTDPDWDLAWLFLGRVLLDQGAYQQAEKALRIAVKLSPDSADGHFYLGRVLLEQGNHVLGLAEFRKASELNPGGAMMRYNIGHHLELNGDHMAAIEAFEAALRSNPDLAVAHRDLGSLLDQEGRTQEARVHLRRAAQLNPQDEVTRRLMEKIETRTKSPPKSK